MDQYKEFNSAGGFPNELRVLAVDDDATSLKIVERLLLDCGYKVTATQYALHALKMLRENKDEYDVVITDVNMPDMDGFKLLEIVGLEMDLPVIMLSIDCGVKSVMKGIMHGAVDYLVKPVRLEELKVIWKHVARRSLNELIDSNYPSNKLDHTPMLENDRNSKLIKKRKNQRKERDYDYSSDFDEDAACQKKSRVTWTADLHGKFINAINQLGLDRAVPKKILDIMNTPELSRENVASHLQKHRRGLKKTGVGLGQNISSDAGTNRYDGKPIYINSNKQYPNITSFESFGTNGYKSMSPVSASFSSQGPHSGHGNMPSSWFPPLFNHYDDIVGQCTISPQASQLGTQKPGPINSFIVKAPTQASFNEFSYESFTPRSNQLNSLTQISQIPLPYNTTKYNLGSNQQLGYVLHCQNTDMLSDSNLLERNHLNECLSVQRNAMDQLEMGPFREPLDVQTNNPEDLKKGSSLNFTIPAEKSSAEINFSLNDVEYEDDLHTALKQFNSKNV